MVKIKLGDFGEHYCLFGGDDVVMEK